MGRFRFLVECRNEGGTDLHCWDNVQAANEKDAEHKAVEMLTWLGGCRCRRRR